MILLNRSVELDMTRVSRDRRKGLTLMELVVVLAILAALAAIVIPIFPNLLRRAHKATDCTQTNEMAKQVQLFNALYFSYPDGFDLLTDGTTTTDPTYLPGSGSGAGVFGGFTTIGPLTAAQLSALNTVGMNTGASLAEAPPAVGSAQAAIFHPTMWPYADQNPPAAMAVGTMVRFLNSTAIDAANPRFLANLRRDTTGGTNPPVFVVFGVGPKCAMVGRNIQDAPTSVPQKSDFTPDNTYSRVGVIFQVGGLAVDNGDGRAIFVASCALEDDELESTEKDIIGFYQVSTLPK
jgi:prepilin-type N-terminal cleavage/methylation domain-containing protein